MTIPLSVESHMCLLDTPLPIIGLLPPVTNVKVTGGTKHMMGSGYLGGTYVVLQEGLGASHKDEDPWLS